MRLISLLIGLLIVAYLISVQLGSNSTKKGINEIADKHDVTVPKVPTDPKDLEKFKKDLNKLILDTTSEREKQIEKTIKNN